MSLFRVTVTMRNWLQRAIVDYAAFQNFHRPCESFNSQTDSKYKRTLINDHLPAGFIQRIVFKVDVKLQITKKKEEPITQYFSFFDWNAMIEV